MTRKKRVLVGGTGYLGQHVLQGFSEIEGITATTPFGVKSFYKEDDETAPVNVYGKSKVAAEQFISENAPTCNFEKQDNES